MKVENPVFIPLGGGRRAQCSSRLAAAHGPSVYPAWRLPTGPVFIPLGGGPRAQCLSRLAAAHGPSVYPAWRRPTGPGFIPLGGHPQKSPAERGFDLGERIKRVRGSRRQQRCAPDCRAQSGNGGSVARVAARPPVPTPVRHGAHPVAGRRGGGSRAASVPPAL